MLGGISPLIEVVLWFLCFVWVPWLLPIQKYISVKLSSSRIDYVLGCIRIWTKVPNIIKETFATYQIY
jgi:hypothetical protein